MATTIHDTWNTYEIETDGQPFWFTRLSEKCLNAIRDLELPSETDEGFLVFTVPTLTEQAETSLYREIKPLVKCRPSGILDFIE